MASLQPGDFVWTVQLSIGLDKHSEHHKKELIDILLVRIGKEILSVRCEVV